MVGQPARKQPESSGAKPFKWQGFQSPDVRLIVVNGVAYLDGPVASYHQKKAIASAVAALPNVRQVVNRLRVVPGNPRDDAEIAQNILERLRRDPILSLYDIGVSVDDGVVTLAGRVSSISGRIAAEASAWSVCGVRHVINRIELTPAKALDPAELSLILQGSLYSFLGLSPSAIRVRVEKGAAYLTGHVASQEQRLAAEDLVRYHPHIQQVVNRLQIQPQDSTELASR